MIKFMHKLILIKFNIFEFLEKIKEQLVNIIGPVNSAIIKIWKKILMFIQKTYHSYY